MLFYIYNLFILVIQCFMVDVFMVKYPMYPLLLFLDPGCMLITATAKNGKKELKAPF